MRLHLRLSLLIALLLTVLVACGPTGNTPAGPTAEPTLPALEQSGAVEGGTSNFTFRYPAGWSVQTSPENGAAILFSDPALAEAESIDFQPGQAGIALSLLPAEAVGEGGSEVRLSDLINIFSGGGQENSAPVTEFEIDGKPGVSVLGATAMEEGTEQIEVLFMIVDLNDGSGTLVLATVQAAPGETARYETLARQIAASVTVSGASG